MADRRFASVRRPVVLGALSALGLVLPKAALADTTLVGEAAAAFDAKVFVQDLAQPTDLVVLPDGRVVLIQKSGDVLTFPVGGGDPVQDHINVSTGSEQGLLGVVADPAFATNNYLYFYADSGPDENNRHQVVRYKFGADNKLGTKTVIITGNLRAPANHDGGGIDIYKGELYMSVGDTGDNGNLPNGEPQNKFGSCLNRANGKILRVSLDEANLGKPVGDQADWRGQPVDSNALTKVDMVTSCEQTRGAFGMAKPDPRIWAWGFRNPFRMWMDKTTGKLWVGDVGEGNIEEVDIAQAGKHHGYPFREGSKDWKQSFAPANECMGMTPASECVGPVYEYDHGDGQCIIGGRILDGCDWPAAFKSRYIFGDHNAGKIWTIDVNATRDGVVADSRKDFATTHNVTALRMGSDNALYVLEESPGRVTRITAKGNAAMPGSCLSVNAEPGVDPGGGGSGGGGAGTAGNGAGGASAGAATTGGQDGTAGSPAGTGGTTSAAGSSNPSGGSTGTGGGTATAGSSGATPGSGDTGGCGCQVVGAGTVSTLGLGAAAAALALGLRRWRGKKAS